MNSADTEFGNILSSDIAPTPIKPTKDDYISKEDHKEWIQERKLQGKERFDRKKRSAIKHGLIYDKK
jgi:hypothetical protein